MRNIFFTLLVIALLAAPLTACSSAATPDAENAKQTLANFLDLLHKGQYAQADKLYAGSYDQLISMNPDIDPADHAALWKRGCEQNGFQCLAIRRIVLDDTRTISYFFLVEFSAPDGSLFVRQPSSGATGTEMPPQSSFAYAVVVMNGKCKVITMPVYVP